MARHRWLVAGEGFGLVAALGFVFAMGFVPHLDVFGEEADRAGSPLEGLARPLAAFAGGHRAGYPYTLHVDENVHWVFSAGIQRHDTVFVTWPTGQPLDAEGLFSLRGAVHERGFHVILAETQELTGVSFFRLFEFLPALWMAFTAFATYAVLRPHPAAIPAAAFVGLVPTTARFLGPAFLVPIGFVLAWMPVTLILVEPARRRAASAMLLVVVVGWAFFVHLIGGFAAVGLVALGAVLGGAGERRASVGLLTAALLPVLWLYRAFSQDIQTELVKEESLPIDFTVFDGFGVPMLFLWLAGVSLVVLVPGTRERRALQAMTAFSVVALGLILVGIVIDLGLYATYARWHPPFFLAAAVAAGHAVGTIGVAVARTVRRLGRAGAWAPRIAPVGAALVGLAVVVTLVSPGVGTHLREPYYHVMDDESWNQFAWVAASAAPEYEVVLTHPWRAPVLNAMAGVEPHAYLTPGRPPVRGEDYEAYAQTGGTLDLFILNDISLVVTAEKPPFEEFVELAPGVWGLRPDIADELARIRAAERGAG